ncbi:chaplin [Streptomyces sp. NPDC051366]|uniref:chaplin n=1 Tax=Streptomyces sp. NPDC051366 TaxID=3365652 RepID=UPI0037A7305E
MNFVRSRAGNHAGLARTAFWAITRTLAVGGSLSGCTTVRTERKTGVLSGNLAQVPVNVCGLTVNLVGLLNPAFGNTCVNA